MKTNLPFEKEDYKLFRSAAIVLLISLTLATVMYFGATRVNEAANFELSNTRAQYEQASASVQLIAEEEATIIRYIGRYKEFVEHGYMSAENRLDFIENVSDIRDKHNLFPISMDLGGQSRYSLVYDPMDLNPGEPVDLNYSNVELNLSLLHEEDLTRLVTSLLELSGLVLPTHCMMIHDNIMEADFRVFFEHMSASCSAFWYTFNLDPPEPVYDEF